MSSSASHIVECPPRPALTLIASRYGEARSYPVSLSSHWAVWRQATSLRTTMELQARRAGHQKATTKTVLNRCPRLNDELYPQTRLKIAPIEMLLLWAMGFQLRRSWLVVFAVGELMVMRMVMRCGGCACVGHDDAVVSFRVIELFCRVVSTSATKPARRMATTIGMLRSKLFHARGTSSY